MFPGSANDISLSQRYTARVTCYFKLYAYPFDVQVCSIDIDLPPENEDYVQLSVEKGMAMYTGPQVLAKYTVKSVKFSEFSGGPHLSVEFELHRRQGIVLFTDFLPSAMLLVVSWATLFVKLEALNVRAIMALTTLLVLYTLFTNVSNSLPTTAAIKLIDIWFFFIIFVLFVNIMIHVFVDDREKTITKKLFTKVNHQGKVTDSQPSQSASLRFLKIYRLLILPVMVLLFNIFFWTAVLLS